MLAFLLSLSADSSVLTTVKVLFCEYAETGYGKDSVRSGESDSKCGRLAAVEVDAKRRGLGEQVIEY